MPQIHKSSLILAKLAYQLGYIEKSVLAKLVSESAENFCSLILRPKLSSREWNNVCLLYLEKLVGKNFVIQGYLQQSQYDLLLKQRIQEARRQEILPPLAIVRENLIHQKIVDCAITSLQQVGIDIPQEFSQFEEPTLADSQTLFLKNSQNPDANNVLPVSWEETVVFAEETIEEHISLECAKEFIFTASSDEETIALECASGVTIELKDAQEDVFSSDPTVVFVESEDTIVAKESEDTIADSDKTQIVRNSQTGAITELSEEATVEESIAVEETIDGATANTTVGKTISSNLKSLEDIRQVNVKVISLGIIIIIGVILLLVKTNTKAPKIEEANAILHKIKLEPAWGTRYRYYSEVLSVYTKAQHQYPHYKKQIYQLRLKCLHSFFEDALTNKNFDLAQLLLSEIIWYSAFFSKADEVEVNRQELKKLQVAKQRKEQKVLLYKKRMTAILKKKQ